MDGTQFDRLVQDWLGGETRRGLLQRLAAVPLVGGLAAVLAVEDDTEAKKKTKKGNNNKNKKKRKKRCKRKKAQACAGTCGTVTVRCKKGNGKTKKTQVDCGSCACDPLCDACFICDPETETCVVDPEQQGDPCGSTGQVCQVDGTCSCDNDSCPGGATCQPDGTCSAICGGTGCFDGDSCEPGNTPAACGTGGETCEVCGGATPVCSGGECVAAPCGDVCASGCPFDTVQEAIDDADPGDTITICAGTFVENITIDKALTITGAGQGNNPDNNTILQGNGADSVVTIGDVPVALQALRITGGGGGTDGGGIQNFGTLTLTDCTVTENTPTGIGGGIYTEGSLTVTGSTISDNTAADGGGIMNFLGTVSLTNSVVSGNESTEDRAGGIYHQGGTLTLTNTDITGNSTVGEGGGIFNDGSSTITIDAASSVTGNTANGVAGSGGGIHNDGTVTCTATGTVTGNAPDQCVDDDGTGCGTCN